MRNILLVCAVLCGCGGQVEEPIQEPVPVDAGRCECEDPDYACYDTGLESPRIVCCRYGCEDWRKV